VPDSRPKKDLDWQEIAAYYYRGRSIRECKERFGFSSDAWDKAVAQGLVIPRVGARPKPRHETREAVRRLLDDGLNPN
jgi:hypothetical protein